MREIKFRAWDDRQKKWLLGYEYESLGGFSLFGELILLGEWSHVLDTFLFSRDGYSPKDLVVMQYTGLKDKNGKEIYEGDLVRYGDAVYEVEYCNSYLCGKYELVDNGSSTSTDCENWLQTEVIGNIYEHRHLLKG